ncbi:MAG: DJ-1/PfpI family protein [Candidatus Aenigmatarchaeota archaeon]
MPKAAVLLYEGFEEIEGVAAIDILRRAGIEVSLIGVGGVIVAGAHGMKIHTDMRFLDANFDGFDCLVLPGGPGHDALLRNDSVIKLVHKMNREGKILAAICMAPKVLLKAGILTDKRATIYPGFEKLLDRPRDNPVVVDGNIITSQGPGTALEFGLKIVEVMMGAPKAAEVRKQLVA